MIIGGILKGIHEASEVAKGNVKVPGKVVLVKRNVLDFNDFGASVIDRVSEVLGQGVEFQLISSNVPDKYKRDGRGVTSTPSKLDNWITTLSPLVPGDSVYNVNLFWDPKNGVPGAVYVKNNHPFEFFLKTITLENVPGKGNVTFSCYSWVYPAFRYRYTRIFFSNDTYATSKIPAPLLPYIQEELQNLRSDDHKSKLEDHDRIYGYDVYNDLGTDRPILGGNPDLPYPRRGRTSRGPDRTNPKYESRLFLSQIRLDGYVPRDEKFGHLKMSDFLGYALKALLQSFVPVLETYIDWTPMEFDTFKDVLDLYEGGIKLPQIKAVDDLKELIPFQMIKEIARSDGENLLRLPLPLIIKSDKEAWRTDEEFGREMLAGVNPVIISRVREFPVRSTLDPAKYGDQTSTVTDEHIERSYLEGLSACDAVAEKRLFMLNHHDALMPYLNRINTGTTSRIYATRTFVFLNCDSTLKPVAIELSLPNPAGENLGPISRVFTPPPPRTPTTSIDHHIWQLAKAYAAVNDSGVHQLISHWLNTHAVIEPFVLATHRQLSAVHPIHKLLTPHYRDTMNINAQARQSLICSGGLLEKTVFPGKYALEMSAVVYKGWNFVEQSLPNDLLKRGVAEVDATQPHGVRLLIEDYPYAVDGLDIWGAISNWVKEYCAIYYPDDASVKSDTQIQAWWKELVQVGHGDKKDEPWWPKMDNIHNLIQSCTTIIWIGSALHAAVNFGQYPYAGYLPNRPTISRKFMPEPGTADYAELEKDPDRAFLRTITSQLQTIIGVSLIEVLSRHPSDEVYLGTRSDGGEWTSDKVAIEAFQRFGKKLAEIESKIKERNGDVKLKNRNGPANAPYTLLYPGLTDPSQALGLTGLGIPNSISI